MAGSNTNVYICGLPDGTDDSAFTEMLEEFGEILSAKVCPAKVGTQGYGFVKYTTEQEAQIAINAINGAELNGVVLQARFANKDRSQSPGIVPSGVIPGGAVIPAYRGVSTWKELLSQKQADDTPTPDMEDEVQSNVYVAGLPDTCDEIALRQMFNTFGTITSLKLCPEKKYGKKYGFVRYSSVAEAQFAISTMNNFDCSGSRLQVRIANPQGQTKGANDTGGLITALDTIIPPASAVRVAGSVGVVSAPRVIAPIVPSVVKRELTDAAPEAEVDPEPTDNLYIKGLPVNMTDSLLKTIFNAYGEVTQTRVLDTTGFAGDSIALVRMSTVEEAEWMVNNLDGNIPQGLSQPISVRFADTPETKQQRMAAKIPTGKIVPVTTAGTNRYSPYGGGTTGGATGAATGLPTLVPSNGPNLVIVGSSSPEFMQAISDTVSKLKGFETITFPDGTDPTNLYVKGLPQDATDVYLYNIFAPFGAVQSVYIMRDPQGVCRGVGFVKFGVLQDAQLAMRTVNGNQLPDGSILNVSIKTVGAKPRTGV